MRAEPVQLSSSVAGLNGSPAAIVCFSHLRWSFVWQRPQHILSRFAADRPVYFVEEPDVVDDLARSRIDISRDGNVTILSPLLAAGADVRYGGFRDATNPEVSELLTAFFDKRGLLEPEAAPTLWYYTPMALGAEPRRLHAARIVYDVMDELASFRGAPASLPQREAMLLKRADVVFTGGPSLYQARLGRHPALHCFPSGVDVRHFGRARDPLMVRDDIARLTGKVVGFYGVLDERLDLGLIDEVAALRPEWQVVMIGPVAKISKTELPQRTNIHYVGQREYRELPGYLSRFDAAILPFARNDATRFISPTKTLEYLAAGKAVVSTSIKDVVDLYGGVVEFGDTAPGFVAAIEKLWSEPSAERRARRIRARRLVAEHDWNLIVRRMRQLIDADSTQRLGTRRPMALPYRSAAGIDLLQAGISD